MDRTINVKGVGLLSVSPDYVEIELNLTTKNKIYKDAYDEACDKLDSLQREVEKLGFKNKELKTTYFDIDTVYERIKDPYGNYKDEFDCFKVVQKLKLSFDFDSSRLATVLEKISEGISQPKISVKFTVKDTAQVNRELLKSAAKNAREKAEILCEASGVTLGDLILIDYNWKEVECYSDFDFDYNIRYEATRLDMEPEDIKMRDTVNFIWEIKK